MSHTGSFIHPTQSPGIIRMITLGFILTVEGELVFAVPPKTPDISEYEPWLMSAQKRFVLYPGTKRKFRYGDPVCFNLEIFDATKWKNKISTEELQNLRNALPESWKSKLGDGFDFKYIATEVKKLPKKFVLYPLYRFIRDMDIDTADHILMKLREIANFSIKEGLKVNVGHVKGENEIQSVRIVDYDQFVGEYENVESIVKDFLQFEQVDDEIDNFGEHFISSDLEIPTWQRE